MEQNKKEKCKACTNMDYANLIRNKINTLRKTPKI